LAKDRCRDGESWEQDGSDEYDCEELLAVHLRGRFAIAAKHNGDGRGRNEAANLVAVRRELLGSATEQNY